MNAVPYPNVNDRCLWVVVQQMKRNCGDQSFQEGARRQWYKSKCVEQCNFVLSSIANEHLVS